MGSSTRTRCLVIMLCIAISTASSSFASDAPLTCVTTGGKNWTVTVNGPSTISCDERDDCTNIDYGITSNKGLQPEHVAVLVEHDMSVEGEWGATVAAACSGDSVTRLGYRDCSSRAVKIPRDPETGLYRLAVEGILAPITASIVVKNGQVIEQCRIASLGREPVAVVDTNPQAAGNQQINFKGCIVDIPTNLTTGEGGTATISGENCVFFANAQPVESSEFFVNGQSVGVIDYGSGSVSSGTASCTTKVISRKLYTWCTCADVNGDKIPDDPIPPCPTRVP